MVRYALLAFIPVVLGCANPDSNACASYIKTSASAYCATFTKSVVTTGLPAWASTYCKNKATSVSKECTCNYSGGVPTKTSTTSRTSTSTTAPSGPGSTLVTVTSTTTPPPPPSTTPVEPGTCGFAPIDGLVGYAAGTTGGGSGSGVIVTSCAALTAAIPNGGVIKISGILTGCGVMDLKGDTTVLGVGNSGLTDGGFRLKSISNVIIRNLKFHNPPAGADLVALQVATKVWVDHCDFSTEGLVGDKDHYDGLLDITHACDYVTVSWNNFHDHWKGSLVGHSDSNGKEDTGLMHVTYHHNYWTNVNSRLPSIRFGTAHIYSSCFENIPTSGINSRMGAQVLVESNYFLNTKLAITTNLDSDTQGFAVERNNIFSNSTTNITQLGSLTTVPYSYVLDPATCICNLLKLKVGTGIIG